MLCLAYLAVFPATLASTEAAVLTYAKHSHAVSDLLSPRDKLVLVLDHLDEVAAASAEPSLLSLLQAKGRFSTREETIADLWQYNQWDLEQAVTMVAGNPELPLHEVPFISLPREVLTSLAMLEECDIAATQVKAVLQTYLDAPPFWKYLPKMLRLEYDAIFTPGPTYDTLKVWNPANVPRDDYPAFWENPVLAVSLEGAGDPLAAWEAARYRGPLSVDAVNFLFQQAHPYYGSFTLVDDKLVVMSGFDEANPDTFQLIDLQEGRSAYCSDHLYRHGANWVRASRIVIRPLADIVDSAEVLHPEGDSPMQTMLDISFRHPYHLISKPNDYLWCTFTTTERSRGALKLGLSLAGYRKGIEMISMQEAVAAQARSHYLFDESRPDFASWASQSVATGNTGRVWVAFYQTTLPRRLSHYVLSLASVPMLPDMADIEPHPKQVLLKRLFQFQRDGDLQGMWDAFRELGKQVKLHIYTREEILGIIYGDEDCLSGRLSSLSPAEWKFTIHVGGIQVEPRSWRVGDIPQLVWK
jgi:hypothetical protein